MKTLRGGMQRYARCSGCSGEFSWSVSEAQPTNVFPMLCGDIFCRSCLAKEARAVLSTRIVPLRCCEKVVPHDFIREVVAKEEDVYYSFLLNLPPSDDGEEKAPTTQTNTCDAPQLPVPADSFELEMKQPGGSLQDHDLVEKDRANVQASTQATMVNTVRQLTTTTVTVRLPQSRYFTRKFKARFIAQEDSKQSGSADATHQPPAAMPAQTYCQMCGNRVNVSQFEAPCSHELCYKCVETGVRKCLDVDPNIPVGCCGILLPLDIVRRVISGQELITYAKHKTKYIPVTAGAAVLSIQGRKRKAVQEKKPTSTARAAKGSKGKAPAKKTKKMISQNVQGDERVCISCYFQVPSPDKWRVVPCGHGYCLSCLKKMAKLSLTNRDRIPIRCCSKEFPTEYIQRALTKAEFAQYSRFLVERNPSSSTLQSDRDYAAVVRKNSVPNFPVRVDFEVQMEVLPKLDELKELATAGQFEHVVYLNSDTIDFVDEVDGDAVEAKLADVYALEVYREEIRRAEQMVLDEAVAMSFYAKEEHKLLHPTNAELETDSEEEGTLVLVEVSEFLNGESKPAPSCTCCCASLEDRSTRRILTCGHLYCTKCVAIRCRMGVRERSMVPAHCCKREFPYDYVREALNAVEFETYERYLKDKHWRSLDLHSDRDYAKVVQQHHAVQCPGCGVGVQRSEGCNRMQCLNGHEFCFLCATQWKTCTCSYY